MKVVIVGGVAGGATAAARIRRLDESAEITIFEKSNYISYANCGLPYYIGGEITDREELTLQTPESFYSRFRINVFVRHEVLSIDTAAKTVKVKNRDSGEVFSCNYDKLVLSPGARPIKPPFLGSDDERIFTLRNVEDTFRIKDYLTAKAPKRAVVVGGGFIGIEVAENLVKRGINVTLVEFGKQIMAPLDPEIAILLEDELKANGVKVLTSTGVKSLKNTAEGICAELTDRSVANVGAVVLSMGVKPETELAAKAGLTLSPAGGIRINEFMQTSDPDVYAAGDAVAVVGSDGRETPVPLAGPANRQARSAATNIAGGAASNGRRVLGASVVKVFSLTAASVGKNEKQLKAAGDSYLKAYAFPMSHAGYYPGAEQLTMKLLFAPDGRVLGAQCVGKELVEKQIDVISAVMKFGGTVKDLAEMELCYAPPYNSAKSPVNMLGFIAENILSGLCPTVYPEDVKEGDFVLDVRNPSELAAGKIPGSVNVPLDVLRDNLYRIPRNCRVIVSCAVGLRGYLGVRVLRQLGFDAYNLSGGYRAYSLVKRVSPTE